MALSSVTVKAQGLDGYPYRIDINNDNSANVEAGGKNFLVMERGEPEEVRKDPIWPTKPRIFIHDVDLWPMVTGIGVRDVPVDIYDSSNGTLEFKGYVVPDYYNDSPYTPKSVVEVRALDGLGTLEGDSVGDIYGNGGKDTLTEAIGKLLSTIHSSALNIDYGAHWYPSSANLSASDNPLDNLKFNSNNYRKNRQSPKEGDFKSQLFALRDICKSQGLRLQQTRQDGQLVWSLTQSRAINESNTKGDLKIWRHDTGATLQAGYPKTINVHTDLSSNKFKSDHTREPETRRSDVKVTYDHFQVRNLIQENEPPDRGIAGFETSASEWGLPSSNTGWGADIVDHTSNVGGFFSPDETANDKQFAVIEYNPASSATGNRVLWASRNLGAISTVASRVNGRLSLSVGGRSFDSDVENSLPPDVEIKVGPNSNGNDFYLTQDTTTTRAEVVKGQGSVPVEPLTSDLPKAARLPMFEPKSNPLQGDYKLFSGTYTLEERHKKGDEVLRGSASHDVSSGAVVYYPRWQQAQAWFRLKFFITTVEGGQEYWTSTQQKFVWKGPNGESLSGPVSIAFGRYLRSSGGSSTGPIYSGVDNVRISLTKNGSVVDESIGSASLDQSGKTDEIQTRLGQGPSTNNRSRLRGVNFEVSGWGSGSGGGSLPLEEFHAQERLRMFRKPNGRLRLRFTARNKSPRIRGHELIEFDGNLYRPSAVTYEPAAGVVEVEMLQYKDRGL